VVRKLTIAICALPLLAAAACSSSGGGTGQPSSTPPTTSASTESSAPGTSSSSPTSSLAAQVQSFLQRPTTILARPAFTKPFPTGKRIDIVAPSVPSGLIRATELQEVGKAVGWTVKTLNAGTGSNPAQIVQAVQQAVNDQPDAVVISGFPNVIYQTQLKALEAAHIPVVEEYVADQPDESKGLYTLFSHGINVASGQTMAKYIVETADQSANTLYVNAPSFPVITDQEEAFQAEYKNLCSSCAFASLDIPAASIGVDVPQRVTGYLESHPSVNTLVYGFPDLVTGVPAALQAAGIHSIKTSISLSTSPALLTYVQQGELTAITDAPPEWTWYVADVLARVFVGLPPDAAQLDTAPIWIITKDSLPEIGNLNQQDVIGVTDYQQQFEKLWGIS
jgi:ribose transport system substrate-binding protein